MVKEHSYSTAQMTSGTQCSLMIFMKAFLKRCHGEDFTGLALLDALGDKIEHHERIQAIKMSASRHEWVHAWKKKGPKIIMGTVGKLAYIAKILWKDNSMFIKKVH
eukprot:1011531-Karenia_brevis.AAC.1